MQLWVISTVVTITAAVAIDGPPPPLPAERDNGPPPPPPDPPLPPPAARFDGIQEEGALSFKLHGYSRSNIPEISVTFENGVQDDMVLEPYSKSPCNFIGQLKSHPGSVAVTGCLNTPDDKMHITLLSDLNTKYTGYELDVHGNLKGLENPFKYQKEPSGIFAPNSRDNNGYHKHNDDMGDEMENDADEAAEAEVYQTSAAVNWPTNLYAYLKFGYDNTMKTQMATEGTTFAKWIDANMAHVQAYYRHNSLPTRINFKYNTAESIYKNVNWPSTEHLDDASQAGKDDGDERVDLYVWFGKDQAYWGTIGLAWVGTACKNYHKTSFNEWRKTPAENAYVIAHEMGHNFGMSHDFDDKHGGAGGKCDNKGIMSYGNAPNQWSTCSVADFTGYYEYRKWGTGCLKTEVKDGGDQSGGLKNAGRNCWGSCNSKQGPCSWCGTGVCCRKNWHDTSNGCDGSIGGDGHHFCVAAKQGGNCKDTWSNDCTKYLWACTSSDYPWFKDSCKKSCGGCKKGGNCKDTYSGDCTKYLWACTSSKYAWFKGECKKSCKVC